MNAPVLLRRVAAIRPSNLRSRIGMFIGKLQEFLLMGFVGMEWRAAPPVPLAPHALRQHDSYRVFCIASCVLPPCCKAARLVAAAEP